MAFQVRAVRAVTVAASAAFTFALSGTGAVHAAPSDAASAAGAASGAAVVESDAQYTVHPGQSLNDVAIALTQSHDHAILARAAKALFDANPNAFMGHDPSRLKLGAVLNVPSLDSLGSPASGAVGASAATTSSAPVAATTALSAPPAAASAVTAATPALPGTASQPVSASSVAASVASAPATASVAAAVSSVAASAASQAAQSAQQPGATASDAHAWSGAIQPAGSAPISGGASQTVAVPPAAASQPASRANAQVSSLQQLLALKNRVLMELQKHGIGPTVRAPEAGSGVAAQPAPVQAAPTGSAGAVPGRTAAASAAVSTQQIGASASAGAGSTGLSQPVVAGIAGGIVVLAALIVSLLVRRRRSRVADDQATSDDLGESDRNAGADRAANAAPTPGAGQNDAPSETTPVDTQETPAVSTGAAVELHPAKFDAAADGDDDEGVQYIGSGSHVDPVSQVDAPSAAIPEMPHTAAAYEEPVQHTAHDAFPIEPAQPEPLPPFTEQLLSEHQPEATSRAESQGEPDALAQPYEPERSLNFVADEPVGGSAFGESIESIEPAPLTEPLHEDQNPPTLEALHGNVPQPPVPPLDFAEPPAISQVGLPHPTEFPREAVDALGSLDMPLPPRSEPSTSFDEPAASLATQPPVTPDIKAKQTNVPPPESVDDAEEIAAGTPDGAAVARLGAMPFGSLKLDFDLELPPSPAQALPAFTKEDIAKIARNKLELASEYIELGDLSGARVLINEVIESNDAATRSEARALLSTLAPLS